MLTLNHVWSHWKITQILRYQVIKISRYQIIKKRKKKHDKIVLLAESKLNNMQDLIYTALINSNISHDEFVLINNVLKVYDHTKEDIKNLRTKSSIGLSSHS